MLGDHGCFQKMLPYDSCSRIPMLVRYPDRVEAGSVRDDFVDLNDILPSVLELVGARYPGPAELPGSPALFRPRDKAYQYMEYGEGGQRWVSIRDRQYKYSYYYAGGHEELFDMVDDPAESRNLAAAAAQDPDVEATRQRLRAVLAAHEEKWGLKTYARGGNFLKFEAPPPPPRQRNAQFPFFPGKIQLKEEREAMNDFGEEVLEAVRNEPLVKLHELELDLWEKYGAPREVVEKIRKEKL
jgi:hypothetical protein